MKKTKQYTLKEIGKIVLSLEENEGFSNFTLDENVEIVDIRGITYDNEEIYDMYLFSIEKEDE